MGTTKALYPEEVHREAAALVRSEERTIPQISKSLGIFDQTRRNWVRQGDVDVGRRGVLSSEKQRIAGDPRFAARARRARSPGGSGSERAVSSG